MNSGFRVGDHIIVRQPANPDDPWHTAGSTTYTHECDPGFTGVVLSVEANGEHVSVKWDKKKMRNDHGLQGPTTSRIRARHLSLAGETEADRLDAEARRLLGVADTPHCRTCSCYRDQP